MGLVVAPFTGAWIEIFFLRDRHQPILVAPFTGAWIEICEIVFHHLLLLRRSLHGSVD